MLYLFLKIKLETNDKKRGGMSIICRRRWWNIGDIGKTLGFSCSDVYTILFQISADGGECFLRS